MSKALRANVYESRITVSPTAAGQVAPVATLLARRTLHIFNRPQIWQKFGALAADWLAVVNDNNGRITGFDQVSTGALTVLVQPGRARNLNLNDAGGSLIRTSAFDIILPGAVTADLGAAGVNGLDTGVVAANTWYQLYVIADSRGINPTATLWSLGTVGTPQIVIPAGYNYYRRIGACRVGAGPALLEFQAQMLGQYRHLMYRALESTRQVLTNGAATVGTSVSLAGFVAPTIQPAGAALPPCIAWLQARQDGTPEGRLFARGSLVFGQTLTIAGGSNNQFNGPFLVSNGTAFQSIAYSNSAVGGLLQIWVSGFDEPI